MATLFNAAGGYVLPTVLILLGLFSAQPTRGQLTVPRRPLGFVYKTDPDQPNPPVTVSFYIDNTCDDSQVAYPTMIQVADAYGPAKVKLVTHLFSLPYHRNSHVIAKGAHVLDAFSKGAATYPWFKIVYDNLDRLTTTGSADLNDAQVLDILAPLAQKVSNITQDAFKAGVMQRDIDLAARLGWKYVCTRGLYGTPTFLVNDVVVSATPTWTLKQWQQLIDSLLN